MPTGHFRFRRSLGNVNGRLFRGARPLGTTPAFSPEALNYFSRLDAAGDTTYTPYKQPHANYIDGLVALGGAYWDDMESAASFVGVGIEGVAVPLKAGMPTITNNNFLDADLDQLTGLKGNGSTKYLDTGLIGTDLAQEDNSLSAYVTTLVTGSFQDIIGSGSVQTIRSTSSEAATFNANTFGNASATVTAGLNGASRPNGTDIDRIVGGVVESSTSASAATSANPLYVFRRIGGLYSASRLATYHVGAALDLATLESLQATLIAEIAAI